MRRVLIIGGPGTGKSTLARAMGGRLNLPVVHLDRHYWSPGWVAPERAEWRRSVEQLAAGDAWVMDGNYSGTFDLRLPRAHALVWLDLPRAGSTFHAPSVGLLPTTGASAAISALDVRSGSTSTSCSGGRGPIRRGAGRRR